VPRIPPFWKGCLECLINPSLCQVTIDFIPFRLYVTCQGLTPFFLLFCRLIKGRIGPVGNVLEKFEENRPPQNKFSIALWRGFNVFEMILLYFFKIRIPLLFGKVIIADRYVYDSMVDMEYTAKSCDFYRSLYSILKYFTPKPDLSFFLDVDTASIIRRGRDDIREALETKRQHYKKIIAEMEAVCVDNKSMFRNASEKISRIALREFFSKYPDKFQGYKVISFRYK